MKNAPLPRWQRIALGLALPARIALVLVYMTGPLGLQCPFYRLTGLYCPGCGSGRAIYALLHGHPAASFRCQPLLYLLGVPAGLILAHEYLRLVFPRLKLRPVSIPQWLAVGVAILIFAFWIARNIPAFSFLAPA